MPVSNANFNVMNLVNSRYSSGQGRQQQEQQLDVQQAASRGNTGLWPVQLIGQQQRGIAGQMPWQGQQQGGIAGQMPWQGQQQGGIAGQMPWQGQGGIVGPQQMQLGGVFGQIRQGEDLQQAPFPDAALKVGREEEMPIVSKRKCSGAEAGNVSMWGVC
jgi:hypothetical protein